MRLELILDQNPCNLDISLDSLALAAQDVRMLAAGVWLVLVLEGSLTLPSGVARKACPPGTLVLFVLDRAEACQGMTDCRCEMLRLDRDSWPVLGNWIPWPGLEGERNPADDVLSRSQVQVSLEGLDFRECCRCFSGLASLGAVSGREFSVSLMALQLAELFVRLARAWHEQTRIEASGVWTMDEVVAWVDANYAQEHSLGSLVAKCALNTTDFSRLFKARTGYPLFEYLNRVRIRHACIQLKRSERSILEIALGVGYNNVSFFNRYFHRIMGITPSEFRSGTGRG